MSKSTIKAIRGMNDNLPADTARWQTIEQAIYQVVNSYGYQEIRLPILEKTELFKRSIGEVTDIVEKEMYSFLDRNEESLTLRPEGTAGCVRACLEHGLLHNQTQRLWYRGPMFRYERPQRGRYRQFYQIGVEAFGMPGPDIDAELILLSARLWQMLGIDQTLTLQLNTLGNQTDRQAYRQALVNYLQTYQNDLDTDSQRRLHSNPLRILDSKNPAMQSIIAEAPQLSDFLSESSQQYFSQLCTYLDKAAIDYTINPLVVRGLDYYSHAVYEWRTELLGAQDTVCAGGRYDELILQLGDKPTPGVGFALGMERLLLLHEMQGQAATTVPATAYFIFADTPASEQGFVLAETIRRQIPELTLICHCGGGSFKRQFKKADKSGAQVALLLGERELQENTIVIKPLRDDAAQVIVPQIDVVSQLKQVLKFTQEKI